MKHIDPFNSVSNQATIWDKNLERVNSRQAVLCGECNDLLSLPEHKTVRHHDQAAASLVANSCDDPLDICDCTYRRYCKSDRHPWGSSLHRWKKHWRVGRRRGIVDDGYSLNPGCQFLEQLKPFSAHGGFLGAKAGDISARPRQARYEALADRISNRHKNNGNGRCHLPHGDERRGAIGNQDLGLRSNQFLSEFQRFCGVGHRPARFDMKCFSLRPAAFRESVTKGRELLLPFGIIDFPRHQHADPAYAFALLRTRRQRPRSRASH